jgi:N6-L-threonylcarbamoyladenine synthase
MLILAIETSCDETAVAVVKDGRQVLSNVVLSQVEVHAVFGGVVPEIASRRHVEAIAGLTVEALRKAGIDKSELDAVAVTVAPGLIGALLAGLSFAKAYAFGLGIPLIPVHHHMGHIAANYIAFPELAPPFCCLIVSGGHTIFADVPSYDKAEVLGQSRDDAAGEAFDKIARSLGLPYPGGKELDKLACQADPHAPSLSFPRPKFDDAPLDVSFSGLKTAVINFLHNQNQKGKTVDLPLLSRSLHEAIIDILVPRALEAAKSRGRKALAVAGGVAANSHLRAAFAKRAEEEGMSLYLPPLWLCGDNAAMIGCAGFYAFQNGVVADLSQNAQAVAPLS